jgi:hypothetical protein
LVGLRLRRPDAVDAGLPPSDQTHFRSLYERRRVFIARANDLRQPRPDEGYGGDGAAVRHCTTWKIAPIGRSAARFVGPLVVNI